MLGEGGFEEFMRIHGVEMIHGGECGLRFTPSFNITSAEIDLIVSVIRRGLKELACKAGVSGKRAAGTGSGKSSRGDMVKLKPAPAIPPRHRPKT